MSKTLMFLCSGNGGNLKFILHAINYKWINQWKKIVVIADRECPAVNFSRKMGLDCFVINFKENNQTELLELVLKFDPHVIITTVHSILLGQILSHFENRLLNLHYSLLPSFSGLIGEKPVQEALKYGSRIIGVTVHKVTEIVDGGHPQVQAAIPINREDTSEEVMNTIFRAGCISLLVALRILENPNLRALPGGHALIKKRVVLINPLLEYPEELNDDHFWNEIGK